jgi:predicted RNase H-like HicB family nuclease
MIRKYLAEVVIDRDADGTYIADCRALPDCEASGATYKEAFDKFVKMIEKKLAENNKAGA